ncbi:N-acetyltransferase [Bacillus sp. J14TS2]|uniref:GNAT family N-acetyltransferase n=1 Tax=Bacillus sp. J14TS2 TaxID=2807188 RepID=UPI001B21D937|nr:GNAT family N-acetyltransferase [Bacillus sp. J14TS2]GIN74217.1 N-acetyltransferase [Bacillus sp. J14TS2]
MLETNRLILREFEENRQDYQALYSIMSDEEVNKYLPWYPFKSIKDAEEFYNKQLLPKYQNESGYHFAICLKENNIPIGYVTVSSDSNHDFGYGLEKAFWSRGIVTEASEKIIEFLKSKEWKYITATHDVHNVASGKVMQKLGMEYKYSYKEQWQPKDILVTFRMYQLNLDGVHDRVYRAYWEKYPEHFIEEV